MSCPETILCADCGKEIEWRHNRIRCPECVQQHRRDYQRNRRRSALVVAHETLPDGKRIVYLHCKKCGETFTKPFGSHYTLCQPCREKNYEEEHIKTSTEPLLTYKPHKFSDAMDLRIMVAQAASMGKQYKDIYPLIDSGELRFWTRKEFDAWCKKVKESKKEGKGNGPVVIIQAARR